MKVTAPRREFFRMLEVLTNPSLGSNNRDFTYAAAKTVRRIREEIEIFEDKFQRPYNEKKNEIAKKFVLLDESGEILITATNQYQFADDEKRKAFIKALEPITKEADLDAVLKQPIEVDVHQVPYKTVPETLSVADMEAIVHMIREPQDEQVSEAG